MTWRHSVKREFCCLSFSKVNFSLWQSVCLRYMSLTCGKAHVLRFVVTLAMSAPGDAGAEGDQEAAQGPRPGKTEEEPAARGVDADAPALSSSLGSGGLTNVLHIRHWPPPYSHACGFTKLLPVADFWRKQHSLDWIRSRDTTLVLPRTYGQLFLRLGFPTGNLTGVCCPFIGLPAGLTFILLSFVSPSARLPFR